MEHGDNDILPQINSPSENTRRLKQYINSSSVIKTNIVKDVLSDKAALQLPELNRTPRLQINTQSMRLSPVYGVYNDSNITINTKDQSAIIRKKLKDYDNYYKNKY